MSNYRAPLLREARTIAAARELARGGNRAPAGTFPPATPGKFRGLSGLGCGCDVKYTGGGMKGYRAAMLDGVHKTKLNGLAQSPAGGTPALIPVSDKSAVTAAVRLFKGLKP